jgi:hypothetical protein
MYYMIKKMYVLSFKCFDIWRHDYYVDVEWWFLKEDF